MIARQQPELYFSNILSEVHIIFDYSPTEDHETVKFSKHKTEPYLKPNPNYIASPRR